MAEWKPIDELFDFEKGSLQSSKCTPGKYTFVTAAEEWKTHESYIHDSEALIFAMAASGSLGRTHYIRGKFIASDLCFILTPKKGLRLDLTFYYRLFNFLRSDIVKKTATGTSKLAINQTNFGAYKLPYFDYDHQLIFRDKIEKIKDISEKFSLGLDDQLILLKKLRQAVLQDAIEGKLTSDWRKKNPKLISGDNHASKLFEKIKAEKAQLLKEGKIKKQKSILHTSIAEKPFDLPSGWVWSMFDDIKALKDNSLKAGPFGSSLKKDCYVIDGHYKIYGQEQVIANDPYIGNYYIDEKKFNELKSCKVKPGDILISLVGTIGKLLILPDDIKPGIINPRLIKISLYPSINRIFISLLFKSPFVIDSIKSMAHGGFMDVINLGMLKELIFPLPPITEQHAIVERVDKLMAMIDELEKQVTERKDKSERLMQSVLREAFSQ